MKYLLLGLLPFLFPIGLLACFLVCGFVRSTISKVSYELAIRTATTTLVTEIESHFQKERQP